VKITRLNLYTLSDVGRDYGPGVGWSSRAIKAHPMSIFPEFRSIDHSSWTSPGAYLPVVVELETDEGITGHNVNFGGGIYACQIIDKHYRKFIEGRNPLDRALIWEYMYRSQLPNGHGGLSYMAISAVDLALWDLQGKILGQPVYNLIGGITKPEGIRCYVTTHPSVMGHMADKGFLGVKLSCPFGLADGRSGLDKIEQMVREARETFGREAEIMIECYMSWDRDYVVRVADRIADYEVKWFEDPLFPDHSVDQYKAVRELIKPIQLALGNQAWGLKSYAELIRNDAVDVVQPEVQWAGGLTEVERIAALARAKGLPVIPHSSGAWAYHFVMAHVEAPYAEYYAAGDGKEVRPRKHGLIGEPAPVNGVVTLEPKPGFGIDLDRAALVPYRG
jgi:L-rhamnonate dehydratase